MREKVRDGAAWFVYNFQDLIDELESGEGHTLLPGQEELGSTSGDTCTEQHT